MTAQEARCRAAQQLATTADTMALRCSDQRLTGKNATPEEAEQVRQELTKLADHLWTWAVWLGL